MPPPPHVDACPGLLALHPARDGHVARIRLPGGYVTGPRWRALAGLARDFGDGHLDLTSRGNVQLRGLRRRRRRRTGPPRGRGRACCRPAAHDRARNIMASPLAGLAGRPPLRPLVRALDAALLRRCRSSPRCPAGSCSRSTTAPAAPAWPPATSACAGPSGRPGAGHRRPGRPACAPVAGRRGGSRSSRRRPGRPSRRGVGSAGHPDRAISPDGGASVAAAIGGALGPAAAPGRRLPLGIRRRRRTRGIRDHP